MFLSSLFVIASMLTLQAQTISSSIYFMPAIQNFSTTNLNRSLTTAGLADVPLSFGSGAGGYGANGKWRFGGEGTYFSGDADRANTSTSVSGGLGYFYTGFLVSKNNWTLIPAVGIGYGGMTVAATRRSTSPTIDQLLTNNANSSTVSIGDGFIHTSIAIEKPITDNIYFGIKGSYHLGLSGKQTWEAKGLNTSVADSFSHWQLSFSIGFALR